MGVSLDGFIADRDGDFLWSKPSDEQFEFHIEEVLGLGAFVCGRKLYETMLVWETEPMMRDTEPGRRFADAWCAVPKVVFSRSLHTVEGNATLATDSLAEEIANALASTDKDVAIGGATLAKAAIERGLVDDFRMFRHPVIVGGGTSFLPPVVDAIQLELIETKVYGFEVQYERYRRVAP